MNRPFWNTIFFIAFAAGATGAGAQQTYRCGNTYSQRPCPGGVLVDTADPRTAEQKAQADQATTRDQRSAAELEKSRLAQERAALTTKVPTPVQAAKPEAPVSTSGSMAKPGKHKKGSDYFTAQVPESKRKTASAKKSKKKSGGASTKKSRKAGKRQVPASGA